MCRLPGSGVRPSLRLTPKPRGAESGGLGVAAIVRSARQSHQRFDAELARHRGDLADHAARHRDALCAVALAPLMALLAGQPDALDAVEALAAAQIAHD